MNIKKRLPLIISVPHAGLKVPPEVRNYCRLNRMDLLKDGDTWANYVYNIKESIEAFFKFPLARAVIDVNRAANDRPPENPDGVVKTVTVNNEAVWNQPGGLSEDQIDLLLERYYYPYHQQLSDASRSRNFLLGLDCHTMFEHAPKVSSSPGKERPLICLGNRGDQNGEALSEPITAPSDLIRALKQVLEKQLLINGYNISATTVLLNQPFSGGYITRKHGNTGHIPWIQVEFNRSLYLATGSRNLGLDMQTRRQILKLRAWFLKALEELFN